MTKFVDYMIALATDALPDGTADYMISYDTSGSAIKKVLMNNLPSSSGIPVTGWTGASETWTYVSADGPTGVFSVAADVTGKYSPGMRVKYTQTSVKYGIITTTGSYSGGATNITIYGGTDYTLANAAISANNYSVVKAPFGFPLSPDKWTETFSDGTDRTQASPVAGTWYNLGTATLSIPIGVWHVSYMVQPYSATGGKQVNVTLSTANNSASDTDFSASAYIDTTANLITNVFREKVITLASKTSYFLNTSAPQSGTATIGNYNGSGGKAFIRARCAYL